MSLAQESRDNIGTSDTSGVSRTDSIRSRGDQNATEDINRRRLLFPSFLIILPVNNVAARDDRKHPSSPLVRAGAAKVLLFAGESEIPCAYATRDLRNALR